MAADQDDALRRPGERQYVPVVLEQHDPRLGGALRDFGVPRMVDRLRRIDHRRVHHPGGEHAVQDAAGHVVQPRHRQRAARHCLFQVGAEKGMRVELAARLLVQPVARGLHGGMHRPPIGHHPTRIGPVLLEHGIEQEVVLAGEVAIDGHIGAHHRARLAALDRELEGEQVAFPQRRLADPRVHHEAAGLLCVQGEMLDRRDDVVRLDALDRFPGDHAGEQRVLAQIFEVAAAPGIARQVDAARQHDVEALGPRLAADHRAALIGELGIEARGQRQARRQCGCGIPLALLDLVGDAQAGIGLAQRRNAQARNRRLLAGRGDHVARCRRILRQRREPSIDETQLLLERHRRKQRLRARRRRQPGIGPGARGGIRGRAGFVRGCGASAVVASNAMERATCRRLISITLSPSARATAPRMPEGMPVHPIQPGGAFPTTLSVSATERADSAAWRARQPVPTPLYRLRSLLLRSDG